jgi:predicted transcriptional regulator
VEEVSLTLDEIRRVAECEVITGEESLELDFDEVCAADLMSDVLAFAAAGGILLTGLRNVQSVITSHVAEVRAVVYVRGKRPDDEAVKLAKQKGIPLLSSPLSMYEACGRLYQRGLKSGSKIGGK